MATDGYVNRWNSVAYAAQAERRMASAHLMPGPASAPFSGRSGRRVNNSGLAVTVDSTSNGTWTVSPGAGVIYDSTYATQGPWEFEIDNAIGPIAFPARPSSGQSRIDLIVAKIYDVDTAVGSVREVKIERVNGANSATPVPGTVPALAFVLATITIPNSGAITVNSSTQVTTAAGGILPVATLTERDALKTAGIAYEGMLVDVAATDALYRYNGTDWVAIQNQQYAAPTVPTVDGNATGPNGAPILQRIGYHEITTTGTTFTQAFVTPFPNGVLHISPTTISGIDVQPVVDAGALSKTSFRLSWKGAAGTAIKFSYVAWGW